MSSFSFKRAYDFSGRVAMITGGAGGIGQAIAVQLAERGARVLLLDNSPSVEGSARALGPEHLGLQLDISDEAQVCRAVEKGVQHAGQIDILVNSAGIGPLAPCAVTPAELWDATMAVNLRGPFLVTREVGRHMLTRKYGRIVHLASQAASVALEGHMAYCTSKAGLLGMTRVMAMEWGPHGITTNTISPTVVDTAMGTLGTWSGERGAAFKRQIPVGRFAKADEIAFAALYLASEAAAMVNGTDLIVDGGYTAT